MKKIRRILANILGNILVFVCSLTVKLVSAPGRYWLADKVGFILYFLLGRQRRIAWEGLSQAFGREKTPQELKQIAKNCFTYMAESIAELVSCVGRPYFVRERFKIANKELLDQAVAAGRGVILVSAHFGNFPLMLARLSLEGYKTSVIMRPLKAAGVENYFEPERRRLDLETILSIPRKACVEGAIHALRKNRLLLIPLDQNFGTGGVYVDFFGRKAATATGPIVLAQRTKAVILPCFTIRQKDKTNKIVFEPAIKLEDGRDEEDFITRNIQKITDIIESYIRKYPENWSWIHRRWKSRPRET